jgi:hypothetical protein
LTIHVHEAEKLSLGQIQAFLNASETIRFEGETQAQIYHWIEHVLGRQEYHQQSRPARGLLRNYVAKMTGLSRAQVTRLIARYRDDAGRARTAAIHFFASPNLHAQSVAPRSMQNDDESAGALLKARRNMQQVRASHSVNGQGLAGRPLLCATYHPPTVAAASTREQQRE